MQDANPKCKQLEEMQHRNVNDQEHLRLRLGERKERVFSDVKTDERLKGAFSLDISSPIGMST